MSRRHPGRSQTSKSRHGTDDDRPEYDHNTQHLSIGCTPPTSLFFDGSSSSSYYYSPPVPDQAPLDVVLSREEKTASIASDASWIPWEPTTLQPLKPRKPSRDVSRSASVPAPYESDARAKTVDRRTTGHGQVARPSYGSYDDSFYGASQKPPNSYKPPDPAPNPEGYRYYGNSSKFSASSARTSSSAPVRRSQTSESTVTSSSGTMVNSVFSDRIYSSPKSGSSELREVHVSSSKRQGSGTIEDTSLGRTKGAVHADRTSTTSRFMVSAKGMGHSEGYSRESWKSAPDVGTWSKEHQFAPTTEFFKRDEVIEYCKNDSNALWQRAKVSKVVYKDGTGRVVPSPTRPEKFDGTQLVDIVVKDNVGCRDTIKNIRSDSGRLRRTDLGSSMAY